MSRRREVGFAAIVWCGVLVVLILVTSAIGLARRGMPLEGWVGTTTEQVFGWTLLTAPYVLVAWLPVVLAVLFLTAFLHLSRRSWIALSVVLALGLFVLFAVIA